MHRQVLCCIKILAGSLRYTFCKIAVDHIAHGTRIHRHCHYLAPFSSAVSCLLQQLSLASLQRVLAFLYHSARYLITCRTKSVTILAFHDELAIFCNSNHIDPVRIFQNIVLIVDTSVRKLHLVSPCSQPRTFHKIFAFQNLPGFVFSRSDHS